MTHPTLLRRTAVISGLLASLLLCACSSDTPAGLLTSGKTYLEKHDTKAAIIQFKNVLQKDNNNAEARFLLGKALLESGNPAGAEIELRKARELHYADDQLVPELARVLLATGQAAKLIENFDQTRLTNPEAQADLLTSLAMAHGLRNDQDGMQSRLDAALASQADFPPAIIAQAQMKAVAGDLPAAMQLVDSAIKKAPRNTDALKLKGDLLLAQKENEAALAAYRQALSLRPDLVAAHSAIISLLMQGKKTEEAGQQLEAMKKALPNHPQTLFMDTLLAYEAKDFKSAREKLQPLLKFADNNPQALELAGEIDFQLQSYVQAEANLSKALQLAPGMLRARRFLALTYLRNKEAHKALITLEPVLEQVENDSNLLSLAGEVYLQNNQPEQAEKYFQKSLALDPHNAIKRTSVALNHLRKAGPQGNGAAAYGELEQIAATDNGTTADLALISSLLRNRKITEALKAIDGLQKKIPDQPLPYFMRGRALLLKKDYAGARSNFETALKQQADYIPAAASLAGLDLADKQPDAAKAHFKRILDRDNKNIPAHLALAELLARTGSPAADIAAEIKKAIAVNGADLPSRVALVRLYLATKDAKLAIAAAQDGLAAIPDNPTLLQHLGRAQQMAGDTNQALASYANLAKVQASSPVPYLLMAETQMAAKNYEATEQNLKKALELKPDLLDAQRALIITYLAAKKQPQAVNVARDVQKQRPQEAIGYVLEGDLFSQQQDWKTAAAIYRRGLEQAKDSTELALRLHAALSTSGQETEATHFAQSWLKIHTQDLPFRMAMAEIALKHKDFANASQLYRQILAVQPQNALVLNNLAWVAAQQKDPKALDYAIQANTIAPDQPPFMDTWAELLAAKGNPADLAHALELQKKAVSLAPQASNLRFNLAKLLIKAGKKTQARAELETLSKLGDKFPAQAEVSQLLKTL